MMMVMTVMVVMVVMVMMITIDDRVTVTTGGQFSGSIHNVTFEDMAPPGGDIPDTAPGNAVTRPFPTRGDTTTFAPTTTT